MESEAGGHRALFWMGGAYSRAGGGHVTFRARCHVGGWWGYLQLPVWEPSNIAPGPLMTVC